MTVVKRQPALRRTHSTIKASLLGTLTAAVMECEGCTTSALVKGTLFSLVLATLTQFSMGFSIEGLRDYEDVMDKRIERTLKLLNNPHYASYMSQNWDTVWNPCPDPEKPFPCKGSSTCIPMSYVCDDNHDCEDGFDESIELCTAVHRPPVEDIMHFLNSEKDWLIPELFGGKSIGKIAHGLAVSQTVDDFKRRVGLSSKDIRGLKMALDAVKNGDEEAMEDYGMPPSAWNEVVFFFSKLIKSGFAS